MKQFAAVAAAAAIAAPLFFAVLHPAQATPVAFAAKLPNPGQTLDFTGVVDNTAINSFYSSQGVTFTGLYGTNAFNNVLGGDEPPGPAAINDNGAAIQTFTITFADTQTYADFWLYTDGSGATITSSLNGVAVETQTVKTPYQGTAGGTNYFGFTNSLFNKITVTVTSPGVDVLLDNVQLKAAVAEPASALIFAAGLIGLMVVRRRRQV